MGAIVMYKLICHICSRREWSLKYFDNIVNKHLKMTVKHGAATE